jgi:hypothetical protein
MSKRGEARRKKQAAKQKRVQTTQPTTSSAPIPTPSFRKRVVAVVGMLLALIALPAAVVMFLPRVTATVSDPVDPGDPFSSSVTVTNVGYLPLSSVRPFLTVGQIGSGGAIPDSGNFSYNSGFTRIDWPLRDLGLDDKFMFALNDLLEEPRGALNFADIAIRIDYEIPIIHWKKQKLFPFFARKQTNGNFYWYSNTVKH